MILMDDTEFPDLESFYREIKKQQTEAHGHHYISNHAVLANYGRECEVIKELGVAQGGTLAALIQARPGKLIGIDRCPELFAPYEKLFLDYAKTHGIDFEFKGISSTSPEAISPCDLLHIDSNHTPARLMKELRFHAPLVDKYIIFHDTAKFTEKNPALLVTIATYITEIEQRWEIIDHYIHNVGYMVIQRTRRDE